LSKDFERLEDHLHVQACIYKFKKVVHVVISIVFVSSRYNIAERYLGAPPAMSEKEKKLSMNRGKATPSRSKSNASPTKQKSKTPISESHSRLAADNSVLQSESSQSLLTRPQVRIMEPGSQETISQNSDDVEPGLTDTQQKTKEDPDSVDFDSTATLHDYHIEVSERMIERCATQLSTNEKIVGGRRSHNSADLGRVRHLAIIKNE
jgi:hypothetical protein